MAGSTPGSSSPGTDGLRVEGPEDLEGADRRVALHGQIRRGQGGSHGWNRGGKSVIGFSSTVRGQEITEELPALGQEAECSAYEKTRLTPSSGPGCERARRPISTSWTRCGPPSRWRRWSTGSGQVKEQQAQELTGSQWLGASGGGSRNWRRSWRSCRRPQGLAGNELDRLHRGHGTPVERQEVRGEEIARIEAAQTTQRSPGQAVDPDARWGALAEPAVLERFLISIRGPREGLGRAVGRGAHEGPHQSGGAGADRGVLQRLRARLPPGSHTGLLQCLPVPSSVLELLRAQGRYHRRQEWKRHLPGWSGQDLLLRRGLDTEVEEIEARLLPVHQILATLSFGANTPRLQITVRRIRRDDLPAFGEELKYLASRVREDLTEDQARDPRPGAGGP